MTDLRLDPLTNDLDITAFDLSLTDEGSESLAQRLGIKLKFFQGEWFMNQGFGIPYYQEILKKKFSMALVDSIFKNSIIDTPGVQQLTRYVSEYNNALREYSIDFTVLCGDGEIAQSLSIGSPVESNPGGPSEESVATQSVAGLSAAPPIAAFTMSPSSGSSQLRVTIDPTASTIAGWQAVWDQVAGLQPSATKTDLQTQLTGMINDLQFEFNYEELSASQAVAALSTAAPVAVFTTAPQTGSGPLRVTVDPTASTIDGWQEAWDKVAILPAGATKTDLQDQLTAMLTDLQFEFNYNA